MPEVLTDEELLAVADDPEFATRLNSEERRRLTRLRGTPPKTNERTWTDTAIDALPMAGGALGGAIGGLGGTVLGVGVGGVPGAVGGAALGGAAGESFKQVANYLRGKPVPTSEADMAANIATSAAVQGGAELVGQGAVRGATAGAKAVYRGFLKPSLAKQSISKADEIVETALRERLPVTKYGKERAMALASDIRAQVDDIIKQADAAGETLNMKGIANRVRDFAKSRYYRAGKPTEDFDAAMRVADALDSHPSLGGVTDVPLGQAQAMKRGLDESIGEASFGVERGATKTAQKVARREIRQGIERGTAAQGLGSVGPLNAREGRLLEAARALTRAVGRESNKSPLIGVNTMLSGAVGAGTYAKNRDPYAAAVNALATRALLSPEVATRAAIVAYRLGQNSGAGPANVARLAIQAVLESEQGAEQSPE